MRVTITPAMPLLTEQEVQQAQAHYDMGRQYKAQGDEAKAAAAFRTAALWGHPAAMNSLALYFQKGTEILPQDQAFAFQLMLDAARHGNVTAQRNVGASYLYGVHGMLDEEMGLAWLSAAADQDSVKACTALVRYYREGAHVHPGWEEFWRRRAAKLGDADSQEWLKRREEALEEAWQQGLRASMPPPDPDRMSLSKHTELYRESWPLPSAQLWEGKLYYFNEQEDLCVSGTDGSGARMLAHVEGFLDARLTVASGRIFLYIQQHLEGRNCLEIREFALDGQELGRHVLRDIEDDTPGSVYFVGRVLYFVGGESGGRRPICAYDTAARTCTVLYRQAKRVYRLFASSACLVFQAEYWNGEYEECGWMRLDLETGKVYSLDNTLSPETLMIRPECYDENSAAYVETRVTQKIVFVDLTRAPGILWVERKGPPESGMICLEPRSLMDPWGPPLPGLPVWRTGSEQWYGLQGGQIYFDGERMFCAPDYCHFYGVGRDGAVHHWNLSHGRGECERFLVVKDQLVLDVDACGGRIYRAQLQPSAPLGESWLNKTPLGDEPEPELELEDLWGQGAELLDLDGDFFPPETGVTPEERERQEAGGGSVSLSEGDLAVEKTLTATDVKYGILTFGSRFHIGEGVPVTVVFQGKRYGGRTHNTSKGRVDGLKKLFTDHALQQGQLLQARYAAAENTIILSLLRG